MRHELRRKFVHFLIGSSFVVLVALFGVTTAMGVVAAWFAIGTAASILIKKGYKSPLFYNVMSRFQRISEKHLPGKGAMLLFIGSLLTMLIFRQWESIVLAGLIVSTYGDAASTVVGMKWGKTRIVRGRTLEGTVAGILLPVLLLQIFLGWQIGLIAATIGMLAEYIPKIDDNITIPIVTGIVLALLL